MLANAVRAAQVEAGVFPGKEFSPYKMHRDEAREFERLTERTETAKHDAPSAEADPLIKVY